MVSNRPFLFSSIASALFLGYLIDASKGLQNVIKIGGVDFLADLEGIAVFFFLPGFFSVMLPAYYLSRGIKQYRGVFCIIQLINMLTLSLLIIAIAFTVESTGFLYTMTVINGFFANMCVPLCYEIVAETGFPKSEPLTAGFLHSLYAIVRMIMQALNHLLD